MLNRTSERWKERLAYNANDVRKRRLSLREKPAEVLADTPDGVRAILYAGGECPGSRAMEEFE
jgi:hypothetical protein